MFPFPLSAKPPIPSFPADLVRIIRSMGPGFVLRLTD
jgi:hypothetical protein